MLGLKGRSDIHVSFVGCVVFACECMPPLPLLSGVSAYGFPVPGETSECLCAVFIFPGLAVLVIVTAYSGFLVGLAWAMMVAAYGVLGFLYLFFARSFSPGFILCFLVWRVMSLRTGRG